MPLARASLIPCKLKTHNDEYNYGFDAQSGVFKDLVKAGIIDPTKVVRTALQDAASFRFGFTATITACRPFMPSARTSTSGLRRAGR